MEPRDEGIGITPSSGTYQNIQATGPFSFTVSGDFGAEVEVVAEVADVNQPGTLQGAEFELGVTIIGA